MRFASYETDKIIIKAATPQGERHLVEWRLVLEILNRALSALPALNLSGQRIFVV